MNILETFEQQLADEEFINEFCTYTTVQLKGAIFNYFGNNEVYSISDCNLLVEEILTRSMNLDNNLEIDNHTHNTVYDKVGQDVGLSAYERDR